MDKDVNHRWSPMSISAPQCSNKEKIPIKRETLVLFLLFFFAGRAIDYKDPTIFSSKYGPIRQK